MRKFTLFATAIAIAVTAVASTSMNHARAQAGVMSHLKLTSSAPHSGTHVDQVINNDIDVKISVTNPFANPPRTDWGILQLRPGDTPASTWTCTSCSWGYITAVTACGQAGGCSQGDVEYWLVGVQTSGTLPSSSYVKYEVDSDDLGNGKRYHASPADCNTTVTPKDDTSDATDYYLGWDSHAACSDNGVSINLEYE